MEETICLKDYYNEEGILLAAKGSAITKKRLSMLQRKYDATVDDDSWILAFEQSCQQIDAQATALKRRYNPEKHDILNEASTLLIKIIFESKQKPWWVYIKALGNHIDWLYTHSVDVALISLSMSIDMNIPNNILMEIGIGAMLHDVGKLLIPKRFFQIGSELSDDDYIILYRYPELGVECMMESGLTSVSKNIILQHRERLDGSGFPSGIKDNDINEYAKIVMIADEYDEMTVEYYGNAVNQEDAINILKNEKGKFSKKYLAVLEDIVIGM